MKKFKTNIQGCFFIIDQNFDDKRGSIDILNFDLDNFENKKKFNPNQIIFSKSKKNVFRGFHFQKKIPQAKLIKLIKGSVDDYILDLRKRSKTYLKLIKLELSEKDQKYLFIPKGCAHGYYCKTYESILMYLIQGKYLSQMQSGINLKDKIFKNIINKKTKIIQSENDKKLPFLKNI